MDLFKGVSLPEVDVAVETYENTNDLINSWLMDG